MKILLVGAGAAIATRDVEDGYHTALKAAGVSLAYYNLSARLDLTRQWLNMLWRARGKVPEDRPGWPDAIYRGSIEALEMALRLRVDWVLVISGMFFHPDAVDFLRRAGVRVAVIFTESPYEDPKQAVLAGLADCCWTNERSSVDRLRLANTRVGYLPAAYDPSRHSLFTPPLADVAAHDVVFVGSGFAERMELLRAVDWTGIDLGLYGEWSMLGSKSSLRRYVRGGPMPNHRAVALYRRAKIALNLHRSSITFGRNVPRVVDAESINPRAYELAACGVFQISDFRQELGEVFEDSVPTFTEPSQLEDVLRAYLLDSPARRYCARRARGYVEPHTFAARAAQVLADLEAVETRPLAKGA